MPKIAVVGSINLDYVVETNVLPDAGETVLGQGYFFSHGGKGANQAVAASRLGADVFMFGSLGQDETGYSSKENLIHHDINIDHVQEITKAPSGVAFIEVCHSENRIIVVPGANEYTDTAYIKKVANELLAYDVIVFQLETPLEMLEYIIPILHEKGKTTIVNPAPAQRLSENLIEKTTYLTPNEYEYAIIFGIDSDQGSDKSSLNEEALQSFLIKHPNKLVVTCGSKGVCYSDGQDVIWVPPIQVDPVDSTGAGDTFSGAFAVGIAEGKSLYDSIQFANIAAGLSVMRRGAQSGMPTRAEVEQRAKEEVMKHEAKGHLNAN
ncbi:ribokinase [Bacillus horti]|uniref:Ribokinase n=1 Tax=Caldalkalibacillus horti TaxID=77523 RepID=A0ABT9W349_9BACI|nr:ribokinase [Bacillus horti]MDQ0167679.1 ribokinase [Bacillus horti]